MATLFELTKEQLELKARLEQIEEEIEEAGGALTEEREEKWDHLILDRLESEANVEEELDSYGFVFGELEAELNEIEGRMEPLLDILDNLRARRNSKARQIDRLKGAVLYYLDATGQEKIECDHFRFRKQQNGGRVPLDISEGVDPYDERYDRFVKKDFDRDALRDALESGDPVAEEVAHLEERGHHLRVY